MNFMQIVKGAIACPKEQSAHEKCVERIPTEIAEEIMSGKRKEDPCVKELQVFQKCVESEEAETFVIEQAVVQKACTKKNQQFVQCWEANANLEELPRLEACENKYNELVACGMNQLWADWLAAKAKDRREER